MASALAFGLVTAVSVAAHYLRSSRRQQQRAHANQQQQGQGDAKISTILFDMDGILADVSESYVM